MAASAWILKPAFDYLRIERIGHEVVGVAIEPVEEAGEGEEAAVGPLSMLGPKSSCTATSPAMSWRTCASAPAFNSRRHCSHWGKRCFSMWATAASGESITMPSRTIRFGAGGGAADGVATVALVLHAQGILGDPLIDEAHTGLEREFAVHPHRLADSCPAGCRKAFPDATTACRSGSRWESPASGAWQGCRAPGGRSPASGRRRQQRFLCLACGLDPRVPLPGPHLAGPCHRLGTGLGKAQHARRRLARTRMGRGRATSGRSQTPCGSTPG
jgi:hypothetical protein